MATDDQPGPDSPLQFDRVDPGTSGPGPAGVACRACGVNVQTRYFSLGSTTLCERCADSFHVSRRSSTTAGAFGRAALFGLGATIAGAALYYGVLAITNLEIGLVAIVIGYMVGWAVRRGSRGWGGLRYQILALTLTYYSVGLAYFPLVLQAANQPAKPAVSAQSGRAAPAPATRSVSAGGFLFTIAMLLLFCFALPVLTVVNSLPTGLISAIIIGVGMRQAWRMTAPPPFDITGPYLVGQQPATA